MQSSWATNKDGQSTAVMNAYLHYMLLVLINVLIGR